MWPYIIIALVWSFMFILLFEVTFTFDKDGLSIWYWKVTGVTGRIPRQVIIWKRKNK